MKYKLKVRNKHTHCQRRHSEGDVMANGADVWAKKEWGDWPQIGLLMIHYAYVTLCMTNDKRRHNRKE